MGIIHMLFNDGTMYDDICDMLECAADITLLSHALSSEPLTAEEVYGFDNDF